VTRLESPCEIADAREQVGGEKFFDRLATVESVPNFRVVSLGGFIGPFIPHFCFAYLCQEHSWPNAENKLLKQNLVWSIALLVVSMDYTYG
jgi:hypothetical protein